MFEIIKKYREKRKNKKLKKADEIIQNLKARYHTFRIILINNERALKILNGIDLKLKMKSPSLRDIIDQSEELLSICYELVDGLNRLSYNRYLKLYKLHEILKDTINKTLPDVSQESLDGPHCLFFDEITPDTKKMVGSKAGSLSDLIKINMPVPNGFIITIDACKHFLRENDIETPIRQSLRKLETDESFLNNLDDITGNIKKMIVSGKLTDELGNALKTAYNHLAGPDNSPISVRSSASAEDQISHSFAGQFKTVLNVVSFDGLVDAFKEVLASNFNTGSIIYRLHAGLPVTDFNMAVLCQIIVKARTAGVLFTVDPASPKSDRMLLSAVAGLGSLAVGGEVPADMYHPLRSGKETQIPSEIAEKSFKEVCSPEGGIHREDVLPEQRNLPLLSENEIHSLTGLGLMIESLSGKPQDIEWAITEEGVLYILQSRPFQFAGKKSAVQESIRGKLLIQGGALSSSGRSIGKVKIIHSSSDINNFETDPIIAVLHQSLVEVARFMQNISGIVVDKGNPADHLSNVAREFGVPMLTRTENATHILNNDQWVIIDADQGIIFPAHEEALKTLQTKKAFAPSVKKLQDNKYADFPESERLYNLIVHLNLTDAYGSAFSIMECRSVHDLIRYIHEMAVLTMFEAGDEITEEAGFYIHRLEENINFHFLIIDMGGGLVPDLHTMKISTSDILSTPLLALWNGATTPGLRWNVSPPAMSLQGLFGRSITDASGPRPVGNSSYAIIAKDYLNLNARIDFHFTLVDTVCGRNSRDNYIRFRFKGGGTAMVQRERRTMLIAEILKAYDFFTDCKGDLVTGTIAEMSQSATEERLVMLGRLLGFCRLMDAMMYNDETPIIIAQAFLDGNYSLEGLPVQL
ncbi:PEP/pyruvate-binding domain-containing protein [Desulfobacterium sp. N47]|uniref:PEP/pyruvate-binding domain-containing protein n=1 Tax=Desulfobacterium sp. N47 TaxID=3115210 RepID=UPI003C95C7CD